MKRVLVLSLMLVLAASSVFAQAGAINLFATPAGLSCDLFDTVPGIFFAYAVHVLSPGATASQWSAPVPGCMIAAIWLSDTPVFGVTIGNSQTGVSIGYGGCLGSPIHVLTITLFAQALTTPCCVWSVLPNPNVPSGQIEVVDCGNNLLFSPSAPSAVVNPNPTCMCQPPLAAEETTWGQVKAIYGN